MINRKQRLAMLEVGLKLIDEGINAIEEHDPYGDMDENFKELDKTTRVTDTIRQTIKALEGEI